jgi:hypothetical protein
VIGEACGDSGRTAVVDEGVEASEQMAACDPGPVVGHTAVAPALTDVGAVQEQLLHARREIVLVVIAFKRPAPTEVSVRRTP